MFARSGIEETNLVETAVCWLRERLPQDWEVQLSSREIVGRSTSEPENRADAVIELRAPNGTYTTFAVEAKQSFIPSDVEKLLPRLTRLLRTLAGNVPVLVVAPWLSGRTQALLEKEGINFIDLTGNALILVDNPLVYIRTNGAARNPNPEPRGQARVRGPKAGRLVRLLADVRPPYGVREIAGAAQIAPGYVSRLFDSLDREALIERSGKGEVESVDVPALLRRWAESYDVLKTNETRRFIAPDGGAQTLESLSQGSRTARVAITGSFAAVRIAPVAAPVLLLAYADDMTSLIDELDLIPADEGANVVLLRPFDRVVWDRATIKDGVAYVAPSQAAVDSLTGTGRMPAEGEALLTWMTDSEPQWRLDSLSELAQFGQQP